MGVVEASGRGDLQCTEAMLQMWGDAKRDFGGWGCTLSRE